MPCFSKIRHLKASRLPQSVKAQRFFLALTPYNAEQEQKDSPLLSDTVYRTDNDQLPLLRIRTFLKDDFPAEIIEPELVSKESFSVLAKDRWKLEEFVSIYGECFELSKGEVTCRNDLNHAFLGYIDDGIFYYEGFHR